MRVIKLVLGILIIQFMTSCEPKSDPDASLTGNWKITSALGNDGRHWTGSFNLQQENDAYKGVFLWDAVDGQSTGTDTVAGKYNINTKVLTLTSIAITGNIEHVVYTVDVSGNGTRMKGIWTGSSDGSIENPGLWSAEKK
ncbi:MAG: hypothetical protein EOP47_17290 [Sphingobacteriaceae bacterium]|nr:MAG: hypothetical protein EOP47_17290 [Sphingobacteriaceae bacterium]